MQHGRHVKIVGKADPDRLRDLSAVRSMLERMVSRLGMRMLGPAHMYEVEEEIEKLGVEPFEDEGGVTGVAVLSTSHCAIHTWPLRAHFVMDVYSCRDFEPATVREVLADCLGASSLRLTDLTHALAPLDDDVPLQPVA